MDHVTITTLFWEITCHPFGNTVLNILCLCTTFDNCSFSHFRDMDDDPKFKMGHVRNCVLSIESWM